MMKILLFTLTIITAGFTIVNAQVSVETDEVYIEQSETQTVSVHSESHFFTSPLQLNSIGIGNSILRYSEQNQEMIKRTGRVKSWELLPEPSQENETCIDLGKCLTENVDNYSQRGSKKAGINDLPERSFDESETNNDLKELPDKEEAVMDAFRKAFELALEEQNEKNDYKSTSMLEIDGMVHDETRSKVGRDFYDLFYSFWQSPPNAKNFTIRVVEAPGPNPGTMVFVQVNQKETFRMQLQPGDNRLNEAGTYAVSKTYEYLVEDTEKQIIY